jgi:hypothetical protein
MKFYVGIYSNSPSVIILPTKSWKKNNHKKNNHRNLPIALQTKHALQKILPTSFC